MRCSKKLTVLVRRFSRANAEAQEWSNDELKYRRLTLQKAVFWNLRCLEAGPVKLKTVCGPNTNSIFTSCAATCSVTFRHLSSFVNLYLETQGCKIHLEFSFAGLLGCIVQWKLYWQQNFINIENRAAHVIQHCGPRVSHPSLWTDAIRHCTKELDNMEAWSFPRDAIEIVTPCG